VDGSFSSHLARWRIAGRSRRRRSCTTGSRRAPWSRRSWKPGVHSNRVQSEPHPKGLKQALWLGTELWRDSRCGTSELPGGGERPGANGWPRSWVRSWLNARAWRVGHRRWHYSPADRQVGWASIDGSLATTRSTLVLRAVRIPNRGRWCGRGYRCSSVPTTTRTTGLVEIDLVARAGHSSGEFCFTLRMNRPGFSGGRHHSRCGCCPGASGGHAPAGTRWAGRGQVPV